MVDGTPEPDVPALENADIVAEDVEGGSILRRRMSQCTPSERVIRQYDANNDGRLSMNEIKAIVRDLQDSNREKKLLKKVAIGAAGCLAVSATANFGLTWTS